MRIHSCRICGSDRIFDAVDLGLHPLADTFLPEDRLFEPEVSYPLQLGVCLSCTHVFTLYSIAPEERYQRNEYSYDSSNSKVSIEHFKGFAERVTRIAELRSDSLICDIGSNVGTLLSSCKALGFLNVLGIEPSKNIANLSVDNDIPTINDFFSETVADSIAKLGGASLMLSSNVVNHVDDLNSLLRSVKKCLRHDGSFVFEVPYLLDLINNTAFDTIYHEHVHYFGVRALSKWLSSEGFSIYKIERLDYMCGSIRVYSRFGNDICQESKDLEAAETEYGLDNPITYARFMSRVRLMKLKLISELTSVRLRGGLVLGIGAATKGNTLLNYCKLDSDLICSISDQSPLKVGKYTPGSKIKIISDEDISSEFSHALILPWNISGYLKEKLSYLNLKFIEPQLGKFNINF